MAAKKKKPDPVATQDILGATVDWAALPPETVAAAIAPQPSPQVSLPGGRMVEPGPSLAPQPEVVVVPEVVAVEEPVSRITAPAENVQIVKTPEQVAAEAEAARQAAENARLAAEAAANAAARPMAELLTDVLRPYFSAEDLSALVEVAIGVIRRYGEELAPDVVPIELKKTTQYQTRFAANKKRIEKGLSELTAAEYVNMEQAYRDLFAAYGMPAWAYDETKDFTTILENNIQPAQMNVRIVQGFNAVKNASPEVVKQFETLYGIDEAGLAAYFLNPERGAQELAKQASAATIAATASQAANIQLGASMAERLATENVSREAAQQGFTQMSRQQELFRGLQLGEQDIVEQEQIEGTFGLSAQARQRIETRRRRRQAQFEEGGGVLETQAGVVGLRTVGQ